MEIYGLGKAVLCLLYLILTLPVHGQVTFVLNKLPAGSPASDTLYWAGSLNNWNPKSPQHMFRKKEKGNLALTVPIWADQKIDYKITRGSWASGEVKKDGQGLPNRTYPSKNQPDTVYLEIESWQDVHSSTKTNQHTATGRVQILSQNFWMPQLGKSRRIWLYLPPNYATSGKRYPVLYMHDGQNLFDAYHSYSGEWGVDEALDSLFAKEGFEVIVVGIDNGGPERMNEYTPWVNTRYGGGKGEAYVDFLALTLKPYIDHHYRTKSGKTHTGIAGSSMGGLISLYAASKYPRVFGKVGVLSPAFWVSPEIYGHLVKHTPDKKARIYFMAGAKESEQMVPDMARMYGQLLKLGLRPGNLYYKVHQDGEHKEWYWRRELPGMVKWLFG